MISNTRLPRNKDGTNSTAAKSANPLFTPHRTLASPGLNQIIRPSHPNVPCPPKRGHAPDLQPEDHRLPRCEGSRFRKAPPSGGCQAPGVRPPWRARCTQSQTDMIGPIVKQRATHRDLRFEPFSPLGKRPLGVWQHPCRNARRAGRRTKAVGQVQAKNPKIINPCRFTPGLPSATGSA